MTDKITYEQEWCCIFTSLCDGLPRDLHKEVFPKGTMVSDADIVEIVKGHGIDYLNTPPAYAIKQLVAKRWPDRPDLNERLLAVGVS